MRRPGRYPRAPAVLNLAARRSRDDAGLGGRVRCAGRLCLRPRRAGRIALVPERAAGQTQFGGNVRSCRRRRTLPRIRAALPIAASALPRHRRRGCRKFRRLRRKVNHWRASARVSRPASGWIPRKHENPGRIYRRAVQLARKRLDLQRRGEAKASRVEFFIDYEFRSRMLGALMGAMFDAGFRNSPMCSSGGRTRCMGRRRGRSVRSKQAVIASAAEQSSRRAGRGGWLDFAPSFPQRRRPIRRAGCKPRRWISLRSQ